MTAESENEDYYTFIKQYVIHRGSTVAEAEAAWKNIQAFIEQEEEKLFNEKED